MQLPLSEELIVSKANFLSLDSLVSAVLAQRSTLSQTAARVGPTSCVLHRSRYEESSLRITIQTNPRDCKWLDAQLAASSTDASHQTLYVTCVPLIWHSQWQSLCRMLATPTAPMLDMALHQAVHNAVFPAIGTLTVVCSQPPSEPLKQLACALQLALTLAPQLLYAAQDCLRDTALSAGFMPEFPYALEYCPGEGFVTLSLDDFPAYGVCMLYGVLHAGCVLYLWAV